MTHYHILTGPHVGLPCADVTYVSYDDSLAVFVKLGREFFSETNINDVFNINSAKDKSLQGDGIYVGTDSISLLWYRCKETDCTSPNWN